MVKAIEFEHCDIHRDEHAQLMLVTRVRDGVPLPLEVISHFIGHMGGDGQATTRDHGVTFHFPIETLQSAGAQATRIRAALDKTNSEAWLATDQGMRDATLLAEDQYRGVILN